MKKAKAPPPKLSDPFRIMDPDNLSARLYRQVGVLLTQLEAEDANLKVTMRERVQALVAIGRLQQIFAALRKGLPENERTGSSVRKYATAFSADAGGRRAASARGDGGGGAEPEPDDWFEHADIDAEPDSA